MLTTEPINVWLKLQANSIKGDLLNGTYTSDI